MNARANPPKTRRRNRRVLLLTIGVSLCLGGTAVQAWETEILDTGAGATGTSIAVDGGGHVHIGYGGGYGTDLRYVTNAQGPWVLSTVDASASGGESISLALDSAGAAHMSYTDFLGAGICYASNAGGSWESAVLDFSSYDSFVMESSIAVDGSDRVHVSGCNRSMGEAGWSLKYLTNASGEWVKTVLAAAEEGAVGVENHIAVDASGNATVSYTGIGVAAGFVWYPLMVATNASGSWQTSLRDPFSGWYNAVVTDGAGHVHVSYGWGGYAILYTTNATGAWKTEIVDIPLDALNTSLAVDGGGHAHLCYQDAGDIRLRYATNVSGTWKTASISPGNDGSACSIAVDDSGLVSVSHLSAEGNLLLTTGRPEDPAHPWPGEIPAASVHGAGTARESRRINHLGMLLIPTGLFLLLRVSAGRAGRPAPPRAGVRG